MAVRTVLLIGGAPTRRPDLKPAILTELRRLEQRRGQMIAAVDEGTGVVVGTIGLVPDRDEGGKFFHLAGLLLEPSAEAADADVVLFRAAGEFLAANKVTRMKFGANPLLTRAAWVYVNRFGSRYHWREGNRSADGTPWPYVSGECDFDDSLERPLDLSEEEVPGRCLLTWEHGAPVFRRDLRFSGPLCVALPDIDADNLSALAGTHPEVIATVCSIFQSLHVHGYEFAWFDGLAPAFRSPGGARWYYLMTHIVSL